MMTELEALEEAIRRAGGVRRLARRLGIAPQNISAWKAVRVPVRRVLTLEGVTGVSRHDLRPDVYPRED